MERWFGRGPTTLSRGRTRSPWLLTMHPKFRERILWGTTFGESKSRMIWHGSSGRDSKASLKKGPDTLFFLRVFRADGSYKRISFFPWEVDSWMKHPSFKVTMCWNNSVFSSQLKKYAQLKLDRLPQLSVKIRFFLNLNLLSCAKPHQQKTSFSPNTRWNKFFHSLLETRWKLHAFWPKFYTDSTHGFPWWFRPGGLGFLGIPLSNNPFHKGIF